VGIACAIYGGKLHTRFCWGNLKEIDHLVYPDVDRMIIRG